MNKIKTAVILASGLGTRLRPMTYQVPKPLIEISGKPLITFVFDNLVKAGVERVVVTVRHLQDQFPFKLGGSYRGMRVEYKSLPEGSEPLGAAGDLKKAEDLLPENEPFLVCNADIVTNLDFNLIVQSHFQSGAAAAITLLEKQGYPALIGLDKQRRISKLINDVYAETQTAYTFACQHILTKNLLKFIPPNQKWGFFGQDDLYPTLHAKNWVINPFVYPKGTYWEDAGTPENLSQIEGDIKEGRLN